MKSTPRHPFILLLVLAIAFGAIALGIGARGHLARAADGGPAPRLLVSPDSLSFDAVGESRVVILSNVGGEVLHTGGISVVAAGQRGASDFLIDMPGAREIPPGISVAMKVTFRPLSGVAPTQVFAALLIPADDPRLPTDVDLRAGTTALRRVAAVALRAGATHLLSWIIFLPLLGIPLLFLPMVLRTRRQPFTRREFIGRGVAMAAAGIPLLLAIWMAAGFDPALSSADGNHGLQFVAHHPLIRALDVEYFVGVDGLSITQIVLTTLVGFVAVCVSCLAPSERRPRDVLAALLVGQTAVTGVFSALDGVLFWLFWQLAIAAVGFLLVIGRGTGTGTGTSRARGQAAATKFLVSALAGSALVLFALLALHQQAGVTYLVDGTPASHTFDLMKLATSNDFGASAVPLALGMPFSRAIWLALFVGFAAAAPLWPFHGWLPDAHAEAPTAVSVLLAGAFSQIGIYALLRFNWSILPAATPGTLLPILAAVGILHGVLAATAATDLRRVLAYTGVAQTGFSLLGLAAMTPAGISGALMQTFNQGVVAALLFVLVGAIARREGGPHAATVTDLAGLGAVMPRAAALLAFGLLASMGLPGLAPFVGQGLTVLASFGAHPLAALVAIGAAALATGYHARLLQRVLPGASLAWARAGTADLGRREVVLLLPLCALVLVLGIYPAPILDTVRTGVSDLMRLMSAR
jgi:NADH-quinone oxidoreductase subunit M